MRPIDKISVDHSRLGTGSEPEEPSRAKGDPGGHSTAPTTTLERTGRRLVSAMLFLALLIGGILLRPNDEILGNWLMVASVVPLLHALFAGVLARRGPLP